MNPVKLGLFEVTALSDGELSSSLEVVVGIDTAELEALAGFTRSTSVAININNFLIKADGKLVLVDAGAGHTLGPAAGKLLENLHAAGVSTGDIDVILLTHLHPDHANGLIDASGRAVFSDAELLVHDRELRFWVDEPAQSSDAERVQRGKRAAHAALAPYGGRTRRVEDGEVLPGIHARLLPGHTPGHTGWELRSQGQHLLIWGDIVHLASVQVPRPHAALIFDIDQQQASATRYRIFSETSENGLLVAGAHLPFPGFGFMKKDAERFLFQRALI